MIEHDETSSNSRMRLHSRRRLLQSTGAVCLGLTTGATVVSSETDDDDTDPDESAENETGDDRTPIDSPTVIDEPGEYELVADISFDDLDQPGCIVIASDGVVLWGNGHTIDGNGTGSCIAIDHGVRGNEVFLDPVIEDVVVRGAEIGISSHLAGYDGEFTNVTAIENGNGFRFFVGGGTLTNCVVEGNDTGIDLVGEEAVWLYGGHVVLENCTVGANELHGLWVGHYGRARVSESRLVENGTAVGTSPLAERVTLEECHICRNEQYGVDAGSRPGDDPELRDDPDRDFPFEHPREGLVVAVDNYWGAASGPSSVGDPDEPVTDPETGRPADGDGDAISEGLEAGVSNVRFDPFSETTLDDVGADR